MAGFRVLLARPGLVGDTVPRTATPNFRTAWAGRLRIFTSRSTPSSRSPTPTWRSSRHVKWTTANARARSVRNWASHAVSRFFSPMAGPLQGKYGLVQFHVPDAPVRHHLVPELFQVLTVERVFRRQTGEPAL